MKIKRREINRTEQIRVETSDRISLYYISLLVTISANFHEGEKR